MNIKQLKEFIKDLPDEMEVCSKDTRKNENVEVYICNVFCEDPVKGRIEDQLLVI